MPRKVVSYVLCSVDGVVESPNEFAFDQFDDAMLERLSALIAQQDAVLLGRATYEDWAGYWPQSDHEPFASFINRTPKYVASTTLTDPTWAHTTVLPDDVAGAVAKLREEPGRDIGVHGSPTLVQYLLERDLVDELRLVVFPAAAGKGKRLFETLDRTHRFDLVECTPMATGVVNLVYEARRH
jgi:dihydrofolate reductase